MTTNYTNHDEAVVENILNVRTAGGCMAEAAAIAPPRKLLGSFWHQNELAVLFADSSTGKSLLAVQVADAISRGKVFSDPDAELPPEKVLFVDFEMSDKQFEMRYTNAEGKPYAFNKNFIRVLLKPEYAEELRLGAFLTAVENLVVAEQANVLVLDSLTMHRGKWNTRGGAEQALAARIRKMQIAHRLSVLVTVQIQRLDTERRLTLGSLGGSRYLTRLADSIFAMGHSSGDADGRYLLHLKNKTGPLVYHKGCVLECAIKNEGNFPHFEFSGTGRERLHLQGHLCELDVAIIAMKRKDPDQNFSSIAKQLGTNRMRVKRVLERHWVEDELMY